MSPVAAATVGGSSVAIATNDTCAGVWFESLYVDGSHIKDFPTGGVVFDSLAVGNGLHTIEVTSQSENPGSIMLGSASESLNVLNGSATPSPTPTPVSCISIKSPAAGATVSGSVAITTNDACAGLWFETLYVDGSNVASFAPGTVVFDTTAVADGKHTIKVTSQSTNPGSVTLGSSSESLNVLNGSPTPSPTVTPTPQPTATPASVSCISIKSPSAGATVSGSIVAIGTTDTCSGTWFESLYIDGAHVSDFAAGNVVFDSMGYANGSHMIQVTSQSQNPGSVMLGSASESLNVQNSLLGTPSPTPKASATATPGPHLSNLPPKSGLPSESTCASLANGSNFPETTPANVNDGTGWDSNNQIWTTPSYFYANAGRNGLAPSADFAAVDGNYSGSTQDIIRWAACKWGVDEDWAYAESSQEHSWQQSCAQLHGGTTCRGGGDCNNPDSDSGGEGSSLSFLGFPVTNSSGAFVGTNGYGDSGCGGQWASWGIIQSKVQSFEWYTWPMIALSTAWGEDYRWAKYRACVNGDYANWFGNSSDYLNAVSRAQSNPSGIVPSGQAGPTNLFSNETNLQYLALGCVATHYSGAWYDSGAVSYLTNSGSGFLYILNSAAWPGGLR